MFRHSFLLGVLLLSTVTALIDPTSCKRTKGCFPNSKPVFTWVMLNDTYMQLELQGPGDGNGYVAIGFSFYAHMGLDYIIECSKIGNGNLNMRFSWNTDGPANQRIENEETIESLYFSDLHFQVVDNTQYCNGTVNIGGWVGSDLVLSVERGYEYYYKYAYGETNDAGLIPHPSQTTLASPLTVNFKEFTGSEARGPPALWKQHLKQAHAILMILAWVCFIPTGMMFARFLKGSWSGVKPGGLAIWFHVHRTANMLGIVLMTASFICILCAFEWKWTGPGSSAKYWYKIHTVLGLPALILAWIQPLISLVRCGPADPKRPLFNWAHRLIGVAAYIMATAALAVAGFHFQSPTGVWKHHFQQNSGLKLAMTLLPLGILTALCFIIPLLDKLESPAATEKKTEEKREGVSAKQMVIYFSMIVLLADALAMSILVVP